MRLVLNDGIRNAIVSIVAGIAIALAGSPFVEDLLYGVSPRNPFIYAITAGGVRVIAIIAVFFPTWRASKVHPADALRAQ